jgi:hypothetical protein
MTWKTFRQWHYALVAALYTRSQTQINIYSALTLTSSIPQLSPILTYSVWNPYSSLEQQLHWAFLADNEQLMAIFEGKEWWWWWWWGDYRGKRQPVPGVSDPYHTLQDTVVCTLGNAYRGLLVNIRCCAPTDTPDKLISGVRWYLRL